MSSYDAPPPTKASLISWWKQFTKKNSSPSASTSKSVAGGRVAPGAYKPVARGLPEQEDSTERVFGVSLEQSLRYASVAISIIGPDGVPVVYGYVPIVVAKCGMMLKESATTTEGIFRVSGSSRRITQLQQQFDQPPTYGKNLDWTGYTVHDAASVLRRYLNMLPDPVIPANLYLDFTAVLATSPPPPLADALASYRHLIALLPPASRYLLLYLLDFLAVFARSSNKNLMPASNLATVFQPGLVSTRADGGQGTLLGFPGFPGGQLPGADRNGMQAGSDGARAQGVAGEHGRGKEVLEFLIEQQAHFVLGAGGEKPVPAEQGKQMDGTHSPRAGGPKREPTSDSGYGAEPGQKQQQQQQSATAGAERNGEIVGANGVAVGSPLARKGSEKSVERRRLRKSHDGQQGGKVKRSRTLPGRHSTGGAGDGPAGKGARPAPDSPTPQPTKDDQQTRTSPVQTRSPSAGSTPNSSPNSNVNSPPASPSMGVYGPRGTGAGRTTALGAVGLSRKSSTKRQDAAMMEQQVRKAVEDVGRTT